MPDNLLEDKYMQCPRCKGAIAYNVVLKDKEDNIEFHKCSNCNYPEEKQEININWYKP